METSTPTQAGPLPALLSWLTQHDVQFAVHEHDLSYTARATARAEGVDPATFAKVVAVRTQDGRTALVVLDATDHLDLVRMRRVLDAGHVRLLTEEEMTALAPDCEIGALPAAGALFGVPMYADYAVREDPRISFNAGTHRFSVRVDRVAWEQATGVVYGDLAETMDRRPAWIRS